MNSQFLFGLRAQPYKLALICATLISVIVAASVLTEAQNICYDVKAQQRYFLGEKIPVVFFIINVGPGRAKVKDARMLKLSMELKGPIHGGRDMVRKYTYDGRQGVAIIIKDASPTGGTNWYDPIFVKVPPPSSCAQAKAQAISLTIF